MTIHIIIENNDEFIIRIYIQPAGEQLNLMELPYFNNRIVMSCIRKKPIIIEKVYEILDDSIITDLITKFKALKENEEVN